MKKRRLIAKIFILIIAVASIVPAMPVKTQSLVTLTREELTYIKRKKL